jgi:hypothetical protein
MLPPRDPDYYAERRRKAEAITEKEILDRCREIRERREKRVAQTMQLDENENVKKNASP